VIGEDQQDGQDKKYTPPLAKLVILSLPKEGDRGDFIVIASLAKQSSPLAWGNFQ